MPLILSSSSSSLAEKPLLLKPPNPKPLNVTVSELTNDKTITIPQKVQLLFETPILSSK